MVQETHQVRVRIAPSPTGDPHVGTAYIALFNYVFAKKRGGKFILRIEDTDRERAKAESDRTIMDSLRWLGLDWDEGPDLGGPYGPYRQSERSEIYRQHAQILVEKKRAYPCFCTPERLAELRQKQKEQGQSTGYDKLCLSLSEADVKAKLKANTSHVIRLNIPKEGTTAFNDELRSKIEIENTKLDDQVLIKSDGFPTYHLANVVDDHLMKITHVMRAEEWISSTPKHVLLYSAFGWEAPKWVHLPLLRNNDHSKISKRKNPVSLLYYRRAGILPDALLNFLALMGWNPGGDQEIFDRKEMVEKFDYQDINLGGPVFDLVKLSWMNSQYMQRLSDEKFVEILREDFFSKNYLLALKPLVIERMAKFDEFADKFGFFFSGKLAYENLPLVPKGMEVGKLRSAIKDLLEKLDDLYEWNANNLKQILETQKTELGWKPADYYMPIRFICFGRKDSPPLEQSLEVLGREMVRFRMRDALQTALK